MHFNKQEESLIAEVKEAAQTMNNLMKRADRLGLSVIVHHAQVQKSDGSMLRQLNVKVASEVVVVNGGTQ